jgi:hypothetical protein
MSKLTLKAEGDTHVVADRSGHPSRVSGAETNRLGRISGDLLLEGHALEIAVTGGILVALAERRYNQCLLQRRIIEVH